MTRTPPRPCARARSPRRNAPPPPSPSSATGRTADGAPVHSFQSLLADLATLARNTVVTANAPDRPFTILTRPTPIQQKAFDLLDISHRLYPVAMSQNRLAARKINALRLVKERTSG